MTGDIVRRDAAGDFWYVDRSSHLIRGPHGWIASRQIEDALYGLAGLDLAVVYGLARATLPPELLATLPSPGPEQVVIATLVVARPEDFDARALDTLVARLRPEQRPSFVCLRSELALTDGYRPLKTPLELAGLDAADPQLLIWELDHLAYRRSQT